MPTSNESQITIHRPDINYRQMIIPGPATSGPDASIGSPTADSTPTTPSSSYDYWWPYPPGGVVTTSTSTELPTSLVMQGVDGTITAPSITADIASGSGNVSSISNLTSSSGAIDSSSASTSLIVISSVPSGDASSIPSHVTYAKTHHVSTKTMTYLIPVFVLLGILVGCLCAWLGWRCYAKVPEKRYSDPRLESPSSSGCSLWRRSRKPELEVGPPYSGPAFDGDLDHTDRHDEKFLLRDESHDAYETPAASLWRGRDVDAIGHDGDAPNLESAYLMPSSAYHRPRRLNTTATQSSKIRNLSRSTTAKTDKTAYTATSVSVYSQVDEDDYEQDASSYLNGCEADGDNRRRRTSSGRGDRKVSHRRPRHARADSDVCVPESDLARANTITSGFRIVEESPFPSPAMSLKSGYGFFWGRNSSGEDKFTPLPVKYSRSRSSSPVKDRRAHPLPQSPPQVNTPQLEDNLCFSPRV